MPTTTAPSHDAMRAASPFSLRGFLLGEPASPWRVILLAALFFVMPETLEQWIFRPQGIDWPLSVLDVGFYALCGLVMCLCCTRLDGWLEDRHVAVGWRLAIGALAIEAGTTCIYKLMTFGALGRIELRYLQGADFWRWWLHVTLVALLVYGWVVLYRSSRLSDDRERQVRLETERLATTLAGAELALLEAQIEPHFLFNTLAHVKRDLRVAPAAADEMLDALIAYLDRASPALQRADWTIADELDLVAVYLRILGQRFGSRLRFSIDAADSLGAVRLPALAIATLVENAVRHGLAPKPEGGTVRICVGAEPGGDESASSVDRVPDWQAASADRGASGVRITVEDDGVGLRQTSGHGLGLATVRARLRGAFGANAVLTIEPRTATSANGVNGMSDTTTHGGVSAAIRIPRHA